MSCHLHILVIYLMFHACINFISGYGKELYVPEDTITVRDSDLYLYVPEGIITIRDNDIYLYDPNGAALMIQTGSMSSTQTGPRYFINCKLQQLYSYRHAYLSNYPVLSRQSFLLCFLNNLSGIRKIYLIYMNTY